MQMSLFLLLPIAGQLCSAYTEAVSTSLTAVGGDNARSRSSDSETTKIKYTPQVAFKCGFRNRYLTENGQWKTDPDARANCLTRKLDILKYCRRVYRKLTVTNIVESSHFVEVDSWCKIEGAPCKWSFWVKPYRCVVGAFESETLRVPIGCAFDHVNRDDVCKKFDHWNQTAISRCQRRGDGHSVLSFAMLEPCGVDMFSGVEFVCCPPTNKNVEKSQVHIDGIIVNVKPETKEQFKSRDVAFESHPVTSSKKPLITGLADISDQAKTINFNNKDNLLVTKNTDNLGNEDDDDDDDDDDEDDDDDSEEEYDDDDDDDDDEDEVTATNSKSLYLRVADPKNEHEAYRNALNDLNKQHREKVAKVMKEWSELEERYLKMKNKDPLHAEKFKTEMNSRFQKTVAALEEENVEERGQIEQVHQQRIVAHLNEKKRHALMEFHQLYSKRTDPEPGAVLHSLKAYVRAEEKERLHLINHYRHLLKTRTPDALASEADLLSKLLEIDRRLRSTYDLLTDHPKIDGKIKSAILDFFYVYRRENTPDMPDDFPDGLLSADQYRDLMEIYRRQMAPKFGAGATDATTTQAPAQYERFKKPWSDRANFATKINENKKSLFATIRESNHASRESHESNSYDSLNMKHSQTHDFVFNEQSLESSAPSGGGKGYALLSVAGIFVVVAVMCGVFLVRRRSSHAGQGFMEVNANTPEECHVANMQITGYENPAYKYFEERA